MLRVWVKKLTLLNQVIYAKSFKYKLLQQKVGRLQHLHVQLLLKLFGHRLQAELVVPAPVRPSKVRGQDDGLCILGKGVLDGGEGSDDASGVGDGPGLLVLGTVEVNPKKV